MRKKFMAMIMCVIMLVASTCMITSATVFSADEAAITEADESLESEAKGEETSTSVETTVVTSVTTEETTTTTAETTTLEDVGAAIRQELKVKVRDIVYFGDRIYLYSRDDEIVQVNAGENVYIVGVDDAKQRYRVIAEESDYFGTLYLYYDDAKEANLYTFFISNNGFVIGDLNNDAHVNACDLTYLKRRLIYGWDKKNSLSYLMSDFNDDGKVTLADAIKLQKWLLHIEK